MVVAWMGYALLILAILTLGLAAWIAFGVAAQRNASDMFAGGLLERFDTIARGADALRGSVSETLTRISDRLSEIEAHVADRLSQMEDRAAGVRASTERDNSEAVRKVDDRVAAGFDRVLQRFGAFENAFRQVEVLERLVNIENKTNQLLDSKDSINGYVGHADQAFGHLSFSQSGEDLIILNLFELLGNPRPNYLDIGAHHPMNISNTALLYQRGCRGINVEANPNLIETFMELRPEDRTVNFGVGPERGTGKFYCIDRWSGRNTFDKDTAEEFVRKNPQFRIEETIEVEMMTINDVVDRFSGGKFPEFLNIDVEGLEFGILSTADFSKSTPIVVCVEAVSGGNRDRSTRLIELMRLKGYTVYAKTLGNLIFLSNDASRQFWAGSTG